MNGFALRRPPLRLLLHAIVTRGRPAFSAKRSWTCSEIHLLLNGFARRAYNDDMDSRVTLPIEGMTCRNCADHVDRALRAVPGVASADVVLQEHAAIVEFDSAQTDRPALAKAVEAAGYRVVDDDRPTVAGKPLQSPLPVIPPVVAPATSPPPWREPRSAKAQRVRLAIEGMHCAACVGRVEAALAGVAGVQSANVNLVMNEATVRFDPARASLQQLQAAVAAGGYQAAPLDDPQSTDDRGRRQRREAVAWKIRFFTGLALSMPLVTLHFAGASHDAVEDWPTLRTALAVPVVLGRPLCRGAW